MGVREREKMTSILLWTRKSSGGQVRKNGKGPLLFLLKNSPFSRAFLVGNHFKNSRDMVQSCYSSLSR